MEHLPRQATFWGIEHNLTDLREQKNSVSGLRHWIKLEISNFFSFPESNLENPRIHGD